MEKRLPQLLHRVQWLDRPPEESFDGVILANEVLDALPVARFRWHPSAVEELGVEIAAVRAKNSRGERVPRTRRCLRFAANCPLSAVHGMTGMCPSIVRGSARGPARSRSALRRGAVLWFDYGLPRAQYYLPERHEGTLVCHFRHRLGHDPFVNLGLQDISAWVDFTRVAEASSEGGFELAGFTTQAHFLAGLKIEQEMRLAAGGDENCFARLANQARQLMMPGEMGERFKAMAWLRGLDMPLSGFALLDLRHSL